MAIYDALLCSLVSWVFNLQDLGEDLGTSRQMKMSKVKKRLEQEVMLLKGTRRPRSIQDRMVSKLGV